MAKNSEWEVHAPLVIAHRGASAYAPENTMAAFKEAVIRKAHAIELDAKLLKDGSVIILHDTKLNRTTNGNGSVYQYSYSEILHFDAGSHFSPKFSFETIPRLDAVLEAFTEELLINVELTNYARPWDRLPFEVIRLVQRFQLEDKVLLSSFNPLALVTAKQIAPAIPRALLVNPGERGIIRILLQKFVDHTIYHPHHSLVNEMTLEEARRKHKKVNVWTVNSRDRMEALLRLGVDGLITDFPDVARSAMESFVQSSS